MGFLNGRVTYVRYRVSGDEPLPFGDEVLEQVEAHAIGKHGSADPTDGVTVGWAGRRPRPRHELRPGEERPQRRASPGDPGRHRQDPRRAAAGLHPDRADARAALNPSGFPTKAQREEAKEAARIRAEAEAADGRFRRRKHYPVLWDGQSNILYAGTTSASVLDRLDDPVPRDLRPHPRADHRRQPGPGPGRGPRRGAVGRGPRAGRLHRRGRAGDRRLGRGRRRLPRLLGQRVPGLALAHAPERRRHDPPARRVRRGGHDGQDPDPRLPPRARPAATASATRGRPACPRPSGPSSRASCRARRA